MATASDFEQPQAPAQTQVKITTRAQAQVQTHAQTTTPAQMKTRSQTQAQTQAQQARPEALMTTSQSHRSNSSSSSSYGTASSHSKVKTHAHHDGTHSNGSSVEMGATVGGNVDVDGDGRAGNAVAEGSGAALSFSQRAAQLARAPTPLLVKGDCHLLRDIDRPPPGDPSTQLRSRRRSLLQVGGEGFASTEKDSSGSVARKRSQYFEDAFSARDADTSPAKERVRSEAPVLAEVRTNVIVGDEFTVVTELSAHLALRYRRPLSSVVVTLQHGACMCFGGSFAPAYVMTVTALPAQLQPATNKRNAALIQRHMEETLGVPPARGHLQFVAVPEANLAYGGKTAVGHADDLARAGSSSTNSAASNANGMYRSPTGSVSSGPAAVAVDPGSTSERRKHRTARRLSVKSLSNFRAPSPSELTPPPSAVDELPPTALAALPAIPEQSNKGEVSAEAGDKNKPRKDVRKKSEKGPSLAKRTGQTGQSGQVGLEKQGALKPAASTAKPSPPPPAFPMAMERLPSRHARRTKSFVATLFGLSSTKPEGSPA
ncbi:hypothetical protein SCUCBS95973_009707 [Sporothrix curviconia]|uniref:L-dopachrome isomerase n=1 Tax=Sporothrix curviconia TaxID=1260050 RepID=A0ABP0CYU7_9PEZI